MGIHHFSISIYYVLDWGGGREENLKEVASLHFKTISYINQFKSKPEKY